MIIKCKKRLPIVVTDREIACPVLPLMTGVLFPGMNITIQVGRPENRALLEKCSTKKSQFVVSHSHSEFDTPGDVPIHQVGVFAVVKDIREGVGDSKVVTLEGIRRAAIERITATEPYLQATANAVEKLPFVSKNISQQVSKVISIVNEITQSISDGAVSYSGVD